jgi:hypothetical protein
LTIIYFQHAKWLGGRVTILILFGCGKDSTWQMSKISTERGNYLLRYLVGPYLILHDQQSFPQDSYKCIFLAYETYALIIRFIFTILEGNTFKNELHGLSKKKWQMFQDWKRWIRFLIAHLSPVKRSCYWNEYFANTGSCLVLSRSEWPPLTWILTLYTTIMTWNCLFSKKMKRHLPYRYSYWQ